MSDKIVRVTNYSVEELRARMDEADGILFLLNSGVSNSAVRTGILERIKAWEIELAAAYLEAKNGMR